MLCALPYSRTTQLTCLSCAQRSKSYLSTTAHTPSNNIAARLAKLQGGVGKRQGASSLVLGAQASAACCVVLHKPSQQSKHALGAKGLRCQQVASSVRGGPLHVRVTPAGAGAYWHRSMQLLHA